MKPLKEIFETGNGTGQKPEFTQRNEDQPTQMVYNELSYTYSFLLFKI
jgi:hypothetical protein